MLPISARLGVLPFGIVVEPSHFCAWMLIVSCESSQQLRKFHAHITVYRPVLFQVTCGILLLLTSSASIAASVSTA